MSQTQTRSRPPAADPFRDSLPMPVAEQGAGSDMLPAMVPRFGGQATDQALAGFVTAQKVAIKRQLPDVLRDVQALGQAAGSDFYYRIPFKDRSGGEEKTTWVEGPSIDCAMATASRYGNCIVKAAVTSETQDAWTFTARFVDLETGFTVERAFQQRKGQSSGMKDKSRQLDIVFQIGQSKAIRNVIVAAIPTVVNAAYAAAKDSVLSRVERDPEKFRSWLTATAESMGIAVRRIERALATSYDRWTPSQMARTYADLKAVKDGMVQAEDLWPSAAGEAGAAQSEQQEEVRETAAANGDPGGDGDPEPEQQAPAPTPAPAARQRRQAAPPADASPPPADNGEAPGELRFGE
jgi:hypothetical protein